MVDGAHAGAHRRLDALGAMRMRGHEAAPSVRFFHRHRQLGVGVLLRARRNALRHHRAGGEDLDEVRAVLEIGPDDLAHLVDTVRQIADDRHVDVDRELPRIAGAAGRRDVVAGHLQPRTRYRALVDGVAQVDVDVRPRRAHVAGRGEAGHQRRSRVHRAVDGGASGRGGEQRRLPVGADLVGQVRVQVDEAGEHGRRAQIDDLIGGHAGRRPDALDPIAANQHTGVGDWRSATSVDEPSRLDQDRSRCRHRGLRIEAQTGRCREREVPTHAVGVRRRPVREVDMARTLPRRLGRAGCAVAPDRDAAIASPRSWLPATLDGRHSSVIADCDGVVPDPDSPLAS